MTIPTKTVLLLKQPLVTTHLFNGSPIQRQSWYWNLWQSLQRQSWYWNGPRLPPSHLFMTVPTKTVLLLKWPLVATLLIFFFFMAVPTKTVLLLKRPLVTTHLIFLGQPLQRQAWYWNDPWLPPITFFLWQSLRRQSWYWNDPWLPP